MVDAFVAVPLVGRGAGRVLALRFPQRGRGAQRGIRRDRGPFWIADFGGWKRAKKEIVDAVWKRARLEGARKMSAVLRAEARGRPGARGDRARVGFLVLILLPLLLMPLGAVFVFAFAAGSPPSGTRSARRRRSSRSAFSLLIAFLTAASTPCSGRSPLTSSRSTASAGSARSGSSSTCPVAIPTVVVGTSLLLLWGPIGLLGKALDAARNPADVPPGRRAARAPLRDLPVHARHGQAAPGRARDDVRGGGVHDGSGPLDDVPPRPAAGADAAVSSRARS